MPRYRVPEEFSVKKQSIQLRVCVFVKNWIEHEDLPEVNIDLLLLAVPVDVIVAM